MFMGSDEEEEEEEAEEEESKAVEKQETSEEKYSKIDKKLDQQVQKEEPQQVLPPPGLPRPQPEQHLKQNIEKPKIPERSKLSAQQMLEEKFEGWPITANEKYIMRLDEVRKLPDETPQTLLKVLSALNPFSQYVLKEIMEGKASGKEWELDGKDFIAGPDTLPKMSSSDLHKIYQFCPEPKLQVRSEENLGDREYHSFQSLISNKELMSTIEHAQHQTNQIRLRRQERQRARG